MPDIADMIAELERKTSKLSSTDAMRDVPVYGAIKDIGAPAVPGLLQALQGQRAVVPVMLLLGEITGEQPDAPAGNVSAMRSAWLAWGKSEK